jgi:hypothetical protein
VRLLNVEQTTQEPKMNKQPNANATKTASITMRANGSVLTLLAVRTESGGMTTVTTKHPNEKSVRGMTEQHKTFEAAKARLDTLAKDAAKQGWVRGKFQAAQKPDAFSSLPPAPKGG